MRDALDIFNETRARLAREKIQAVLSPLDERIRAAKEDGLPEDGIPDELRAERVRTEKEFLLAEVDARLEKKYPSGLYDWLYVFQRDLYERITGMESALNVSLTDGSPVEGFKNVLRKYEDVHVEAIKGYESGQGTLLSIEGISALRVRELERLNLAVEVDSRILDCRVWICGTKAMADQLRKDAPDAVVFTTGELRNLVKLNPGPEALKQIVTAKEAFPGSRIVDGIPKGNP